MSAVKRAGAASPSPFSPDEFGPETGLAAPDRSLETIGRVAAAIAAYDGIHVETDRHDAIQSHYELVMACGFTTKGRPQLGGRVLGPSGSGKTTAARFFQAAVEERGLHAAGEKPVLIVPLDRACTSRRLFSSILRELGDGFYEKGTEELLQKRSYEGLRRLGVKLLVIDETQHLKFRSTHRNDITDTLKRVLDDALCPIMFIGTDDAVSLLNDNKQLANRLHPPCDLPPLDVREAADRRIFKDYVLGIDDGLVEAGLMSRISRLGEKRRLSCLMEISGGVLGRVSNLVRAALAEAVGRGAEIVEVCDLAAATSSWAIAQEFIDYNPFLTGVRPKPSRAQDGRH